MTTVKISKSVYLCDIDSFILVMSPVTGVVMKKLPQRFFQQKLKIRETLSDNLHKNSISLFIWDVPGLFLLNSFFS